MPESVANRLSHDALPPKLARGWRCARGSVGLALAGLALLALVDVRPANADSVCSEAFAKWVKSSQATYQSQAKATSGPGEAGREACLPSEDARRMLQRALVSVRRHCDAPDAASEAQTTKPMIEINADVLASAPVCADTGWAATPTPATAPSAAVPKSPGTPAGQPTPAAVPTRDVDPNSCLALGQTGKTYWIENTLCPGARVIVVVEIKLASGIRKCHGHIVTAQTMLGSSKPYVNYECLENEGDCSTKSVKQIFPYCTW